MMILPFVFLIVLIALSSGAPDHDNFMKFTALKFTEDQNSYVQFRPDFSPFTHVISVCGWIKSLGSSEYPTILHYGHYQLTLLDNGRWVCILGSCTHMSSNFHVTKNTWYHTCVVWSTSSSSHKYYVNGELLGTLSTRSDRLLKTGGQLTVGNWGGDYYNTHQFGGELFYLNFYTKEMSAEEVRRVVSDGMCANMVLDEHKEARMLGWEKVLEQSRSVGSVTEVDMTGECVSTLIAQVIGKLRAGDKLEDKVTEVVEAAENKLNDHTENTEMSLNLKQDLENVSKQLSTALMKLEDVKQELGRTKGELKECYREMIQEN